jgi:hypothetical protein
MAKDDRRARLLWPQEGRCQIRPNTLIAHRSIPARIFEGTTIPLTLRNPILLISQPRSSRHRLPLLRARFQM